MVRFLIDDRCIPFSPNRNAHNLNDSIAMVMLMYWLAVNGRRKTNKLITISNQMSIYLVANEVEMSWRCEMEFSPVKENRNNELIGVDGI